MSRLASTMAEGRERSKECEGTVRSVCFRDHELGIKHCYCTSQMRRAACFVVFMQAHWVSVIGFLWKDDEGLISRLIYPARSHWDTRSLLPESPGSQHLMKKEDQLCMLLRYQCSLKASVGVSWRSWRKVWQKTLSDTSSVLACMLYRLFYEYYKYLKACTVKQESNKVCLKVSILVCLSVFPLCAGDLSVCFPLTIPYIWILSCPSCSVPLLDTELVLVCQGNVVILGVWKVAQKQNE